MSAALDIYRVHIENMRAVDTGLVALLETGRRAIRERRERHLEEVTRAALLMLGVKLETRLGSIIHHPGGFTESERREIQNANAKAAWSLAVDVGFRRRTNRWSLEPSSIGLEQNQRYLTVREAVDAQLAPIVEVRNRLAHGQWQFVLNAKGTSLNPDVDRLIKSETIQSIKIKDTLASHIARLVEDLVTTSTAFERDYEKSFDVVASTLVALETADFGRYCAELRSRYDLGQLKRSATDASKLGMA